MWQEITRHCQVLDTLLLARQQNPGQRNSLDALCKRYDIDNSHRQLHGALLDAEILGRVYLAMTGGQTSLLLSDDPSPHTDASSQTLHQEIAIPRTQLSGFAVVKATETETAAHADYLKMLAKASGGDALWQKLQTVN
jgi:DNA polymerase-3 subunit epsilon